MDHTLLKLSKIAFSKDVTNYYPEILSNEALDFLSALHEKFNTERLQLLQKRLNQQKIFDEGKFPNFQKRQKKLEIVNGELATFRMT